MERSEAKQIATEMLNEAFKEMKYSVAQVRNDEGGRFYFELTHLGYTGVTFADMAKVSETFDTKHINVSAYDAGGCPTCGSEIEYTLEVSNAKIGD